MHDDDEHVAEKYFKTLQHAPCRYIFFIFLRNAAVKSETLGCSDPEKAMRLKTESELKWKLKCKYKIQNNQKNRKAKQHR